METALVVRTDGCGVQDRQGAARGRNRTSPPAKDSRNVSGRSDSGREAPSDAEAWDHVIRWVEENRGLLVRNAQRTYASFGPYDREDYLQQATLAGFHAWKDCVRAGEPERFIGYLFMRLRRECRDEMGIRRDAPASLRCEDRVLVPAEGLPHGPETTGHDGDEEHAVRRRALLWQALRWMTSRQQVAWLLALGYLGHGEATPKDIARALKISRRAAAALLARGQAQAERGVRREQGSVGTCPVKKYGEQSLRCSTPGDSWGESKK